MHDPMTDADQSVRRKPLAEKSDQVFERSVVAELRAATPRFLVQHGARAIFRNEPRRRVNRLGLSARYDDRTAGFFRE